MNWRVFFPLLGVACGIYLGATIAGQRGSWSRATDDDRAGLTWLAQAAVAGRLVTVCKHYR